MIPDHPAALTEKILHLIAEEMAIEEAELSPNASFTEDLNLDEIDIAELLMQAEQQLGAREFSDADWEQVRTVGDFIQIVEQHLERKAKPAAKGKESKPHAKAKAPENHKKKPAEKPKAKPAAKAKTAKAKK